MPPVTLGEPPNRRLHIGLVATHFIKAGMELFFDYGIKGDYPWLKSDAESLLNRVYMQICNGKTI